VNQATKESASAELRCREAFEEYITAKYCAIYLEVDQHNDYVSAEVTGRWQAFQAAWNRSTPRADSADYAELRRLAMAATPGPWEASRCSIYNADRSMMIYDEGGHSEADAAFIATFNPAKVLAMIDRLEELEGRK
jgi:hypothetical protein